MTIWKYGLTALVAAATGATALVAPAAAQEYSATYAQDRAEIEDLMARYLFAIDYFDWDAYIATFAPDAELEFASGTYRGHDEIRTAVTNFSEGIGRFYHTEDGQPAKLRHVVLQSVVRVEGDRAWATTLWVEMANNGPADEMKMGTYGIYRDEFSRPDGRWLIQRRNVLNEFIPNRGSGPGNPVTEMDGLADAHRATGGR
ncbi:nuclear transport factor 2 family protein [Altererythrobacter sp. KTW20L]|uniref:nuclear transport factor 2 family protein n=1 Tax=Altererythrobacter sp. KTW20L TaxID=2942210 RepID=UPI0020BFFC58|nr:nuclear transport factor 2 family protein [Altererythrobacter sp. KTW20L]MCL6252057.1 nuclear transport factor 2 family protein [Altererythrobacter sp. KTW20L]